MNNKLYDNIFQLRFSSKQMERLSKKAEKEQKKEENKLKSALQNGNIDIARVYGENAVRKKNESLNFLRMASRLDAVVSRLQSTAATQMVASNMKSVVGSLDKAISSMDLEKVSAVMEKFESQFENLDVHSSVLQDSMSNATTTSTPQNEVELLMRKVADEAGLEINEQLQSVNVPSSSLAQPSAAKEDNLSKRLAALRQ